MVGNGEGVRDSFIVKKLGKIASLQESSTQISWDLNVYNLEMLQVRTTIDYSNIASYIILRVEVHVCLF